MRETDVPFSVTANGYQTGKIAAGKSLDLLQRRYQDQRGRILEIVGDPADSHSTAFQKGFESVIEESRHKGNTGIELISKPAMNWDPANALSIIKETKDLKRIDIIIAHAAHLLRPVVAFLRAKGEEDHVEYLKQILLMSTNGAPVGLRNITDQVQVFEFEQPLYAEVYSLAKFFYEWKKSSEIGKDHDCKLFGSLGHVK